MLWKLCRSQQKYESALAHPLIHVSVEFHNVLYCELGDSFCVLFCWYPKVLVTPSYH